MTYTSGQGMGYTRSHDPAPQGYRLLTFIRPSSGGTEKGGSLASFYKCIDPTHDAPTNTGLPSAGLLSNASTLEQRFPGVTLLYETDS